MADGSDQEDGDDEAVPAGRPDKIKDGVELSSDDEEGAANGAGGASVAEDSDEEEARDILRMKEQVMTSTPSLRLPLLSTLPMGASNITP